MNKWYMHNPSPLLENNTHKPLIIISKKKTTFKIVDFALRVDHKIKLKECDKYKYPFLGRELKKKTMEYAGDNYTYCNWSLWNNN